MITEKVRHRTTPSEPWGKPGEHGRITWTKPKDEGGHLRITPGTRTIPAAAFVEWESGYQTWERLSDLISMGRPKQQS